MILMESAVKIRCLVLRDGRSIRSVSRSTGLSRNTIKKYLKDATPPRYHRIAVKCRSDTSYRVLKIACVIFLSKIRNGPAENGAPL